MSDRISAWELRAAGIPIPDTIPDCATVARSAVSMSVQDEGSSITPDGRMTVGIGVAFAAPFEWVEVDLEIKEARVEVLDHGYIKVVESWGSDERIIEAARMSTGKGFLGWGDTEDCTHCNGSGREPMFGPNHHCRVCGGAGKRINKPGDEKLLKFLYDNKHHTPFEMAGCIIEVQAPIMVFREWHRHRTQSYNELSARYTPLPDVNYVPTPERCLMVAGASKQSAAVAGADALTHDKALGWLLQLEQAYEHAERVYQEGLRIGIPKELARLPVPVGRYSRMRASANLRNWLGMLVLRSDRNPGAQWEFRQYANVLAGFLRELFPRTMQLFDGEA